MLSRTGARVWGIELKRRSGADQGGCCTCSQARGEGPELHARMLLVLSPTPERAPIDLTTECSISSRAWALCMLKAWAPHQLLSLAAIDAQSPPVLVRRVGGMCAAASFVAVRI